MKATETTSMPGSSFEHAEVKYDGFRCLVMITNQSVELKSKNGRRLNHCFPEIVAALEQVQQKLFHELPLVFDGELVCLQNPFSSHFYTVQTRSRMTNSSRIKAESISRPCQWIAFDLPIPQKNYGERREGLLRLCKQAHLSILTENDWQSTLHIIPSNDIQSTWNIVQQFNSEGIIAKRDNSFYQEAVRTKEWLKYKRYRYIHAIVTFFENVNGYFHGSVYDRNRLVEVAVFKHGLSNDEKNTLKRFFQAHGKKEKNGLSLEPSIIVELGCIDFSGGKLREVFFHKFLHEIEPQEVTMLSLYRSMYPLPEVMHTTSLDKPLWQGITKKDYLHYLQGVSSYMLPFLRNRALTVIRFPHGTMETDRFYQKHVPDYAPEFVQTAWLEDIEYILCNNPDTLLWLGNQLALELHIPFQPIHFPKPSELVLDLDPPNSDAFRLAREAAIDIKLIFERLGLPFFCKTTGGKGLQVHVPLEENAITYTETEQLLSFIAKFLSTQKKERYTTERMKRNRNGRLYLDSIQHGYNKTVIAPYSMRETGYVATPLFDDELHSPLLSPAQFTQQTVFERLFRFDNPFTHYETKRVSRNDFLSVLEQIK